MKNNHKRFNRPEKNEKLDKALDAIKEKYGEDAVSRASLLNKDKIKKH